MAITYENEVITSQSWKQDRVCDPNFHHCDRNPAALIDTYVNKHGNWEVVEAFIDFLHSDSVQQAFAKNGYRPADEALLQEFASQYPPVEDLGDYLSWWLGQD